MENQSMPNPFGKQPEMVKATEKKEENPIIERKEEGPSAENNNPSFHFFLYLLSFLSMMFMATGLGTILYQMINKGFPEKELAYSYFSMFTQQAVKFGLASLIIATPIYYFLIFLINKYLYQGVIKKNSKVRNWVTFVILYLAASIILSDSISLIYTWLGGDIAARFVLKFLVVLSIAGAIFGYYFWDIRKRELAGIKYPINKIFGAASFSFILLVFVWSFFVVDSPTKTRDKKIDGQTISAMKDLNYSIQGYYNKNGQLPENMDDLKDSFYKSKQNEENPIEYKKSNLISYQLCANFRLSNMNESEEDGYQALYYLESDSSEEWKHEKGRYCFEKEVKKKQNLGRPLNMENDAAADYWAYAGEQDEQLQSQYANPNQGVTNIPLQAVTESREKATLASIKSSMSSLVVAGVICRDEGGTIVGGLGGENFCSASSGGNQLKWPSFPACGDDPGSTQWHVLNGDNDKWDFAISCKNFANCDGPANAICSASGCKFQGTCQ